MKSANRKAMFAKLSKYKVVAYRPHTNNRFPTMRYGEDARQTALGINMWRGRVYELQSNNKYKIIKDVWN